MKNLLLALMLLTGFSSIAQVSNAMSEENKKLLDYLNKKESERAFLVKDYLLNNPDTPEFIYSNGVLQSYLWNVINNRPFYMTQFNIDAARATKTNQLMPGGSSNLNLDGTGITVGVWEVNIPQADHVEFFDSSGSIPRVTMFDFVNQDGTTTEDSHATHVIGTVAATGVFPTAQGMARNALIKSYNSGNDVAEMTTEAANISSPMLVSNHSYGAFYPNDPADAWFLGAYVSRTASIDQVARNNPLYLSVWAAGNDGFETNTSPLFAGYDKLNSATTAKNNLVVANADPTVTEQPLFSGNYVMTNLPINNSSSEGPTDDLRIKPDIAADGTNLVSANPNNSYGTSTGTSMASPNTAGTLALLQQYYNQLNGNYMLSATLKGIVCHTAVDEHEISPIHPTSFTGPDPIFGWGFLDAKASADVITNANSGGAVIEENTLGQGETYSFTFSAQAGERLSATICWTDMPGSPTANGDLNNQTPKLVNDLDIRISKDGTDYFPWRLDYNASTGFSNSKGDNIRDNIERVDIEAPTSGTYTLTVTHKGTLQGDVGGPFDPQSQDFSLIVTGSNLSLGIDENDLARKLSVYPNPSNGEFTISFESNLNTDSNIVKIGIYDVQGRLVYDNDFANTSSIFKETISLGDVKSGIYMVNITEGNRTTSHKLVIE